MASKLKDISDNSKRNTSTTVSTTIKENKEPPTGAKIFSKTVRTETEEIENGYLISKNFDISYEDKAGNRQYTYYTKKWYSKTDPLTITLNDKSLADEFDETTE